MQGEYNLLKERALLESTDENMNEVNDKLIMDLKGYKEY